jgi:hypothetical protein
MSLTKTKYDSCELNQQQTTNKSIFQYVVDNNNYVNKNQCLNVIPPFISYIPLGIPQHNVDIENELRGTTRSYTKCSSCQYQPTDKDLVQKIDNKTIYNKNECNPENQILPNGYMFRK